MSHRPKIDNSVKGSRSNQNLSCNWTGSADFGRLVPIDWFRVYETDKVISLKPRIEMQMLPIASPTFGKIDLYCHYFAVPFRQIQDSFYEIWSRTGVNKDDELHHTNPSDLTVAYHDNLQTNSMRRAAFKHWTSLGLNPFFAMPWSKVGTSEVNPVSDTDSVISLLPFFAYNKIWWDFYRDPEVLRDESKGEYLFSGQNPSLINDQNFVNKYMMPKVRSIKNTWISDLYASDGRDYSSVLNDSDSMILPFLQYDPNNGADLKSFPHFGNFNGVADTDLNATNDTEQSVQMRRLAESLTRLSERLSLSGKREIEALFARYGVKPKWSEMNLCRYLGGAKSTVLVSDIVSTASTEGSPLGAKAGAGYCALNNLSIEASFDEPCIVMGIISVMPHIHFVQGLSKKWSMKYVTDLFQSSLQYVGNVAVARKEVAYKYRDNQQYDTSKDNEAFAYVDPYYEDKMGVDVLAGDFMTYHSVELPTDEQAKKDILYMQSMEQFIDFPYNRQFNLDNMLVDGDQYNKIFSYLGGSIWENVDDHFHLCIDKEIYLDRPFEGFAIPTLETTADPHKDKTTLSQDKML